MGASTTPCPRSSNYSRTAHNSHDVSEFHDDQDLLVYGGGDVAAGPNNPYGPGPTIESIGGDSIDLADIPVLDDGKEFVWMMPH